MSDYKRIPVSEERWKELGELKRAGQTYDELLDELIGRYRDHRLAQMVRETREHGRFVELDAGGR